METNENMEKALDQFLTDDKSKIDTEPKKVIKKKGDLVEKVDIDKKLVVEDGRELLREITHNRYE
jgi:hypothetical protein